MSLYNPIITWDSATKSTGATLDSTNLQVSFSASPTNGVKSTIGRTSGKWYCEITVNIGLASMIGIADSTVNMNTNLYTQAGTKFYYGNNGNKYINGTSSTYGASYTSNDTISILLDLDNKKLEFWKNGVTQGVMDSALGSLSGDVYIAVGQGSSSTHTYTANFGATVFKYALPTGYSPYFKYLYKHLFNSTSGELKTFNLPDNSKTCTATMTVKILLVEL